MSQNAPKRGFCGLGRWLGTAEVYGGDGRFLGNAADNRHVRSDTDDGRVRIDLSFVGPLKFAGHYFIREHSEHRVYEGPANYGYAEALADNLVVANAYWPLTGLSQRFFLLIMPGGTKQLSLALMSRGEQLIYTIVGEYHRITGEEPGIMPGMVNGTAYDLERDPAAGRASILLHRPGRWTGELMTLDGDLQPAASSSYREELIATDEGLRMSIAGSAFAPESAACELRTNGLQAWTAPGQLVGSYSLCGGRALCGHFHHLVHERRVWRREVVSHDGAVKAVVHTWYRGEQRIGIQHGVLEFTPNGD